MDFLTENLNQFSEETISLLSFGACIGQSFSVEDLSTVCGLPEREINRRLITAVAQEAVYPIEKDGKIGLQTMYQFAHDRFQQVFYTTLSEKTRASVHYLLGKRYEEYSRAAGVLDNGRLKSRTTMQWGLGRRRIRKKGARIQEFLLGTAHRCGAGIRLRHGGAVPEPPALPAGAEATGKPSLPHQSLHGISFGSVQSG